MSVSPDPVIQYYNVVARYPANNQQWWLARSSTDDTTKGLVVGDFMPELLQKLYMGNMHSPRGHYVLNAFNKDRSTISGIPGIAAEVIDERPSTVSFFSGRVWFACNSTVYFGQVMTMKSQAALCHMDADPTSENINDPVETDGGVIPIPEANKIIRLLPHGGGMLVFAYNGVWFVAGTAEGFTALDITVSKISPIGCRSPKSVVETDSAVYWWSDVGIMGISQSGQQGQFGPVNSNLSGINISEPVIHSFYNAISDTVKADVIGLYDGKINAVYWLYRSEDTASTEYDRVLCLDLGLGAFYPWKFSFVTNGPVIKGFYINPNRNNSYTIPTDLRPSQIEYITLVRGTPATLRIAQVRSGKFTDWYTYNSVGVTYDSFIETGYELFDDSMRRKNLVYMYTYLTQTETAATGDTPDYPSACNLTIKWDWSKSTLSNQETAPVPINLYRRLMIGSADTGYQMIVNKLKVRGNGKAIQFRFESSEAGKNFDLNGWAVEVSGEPVP